MPQLLRNKDIAPPESTGGDSFRYVHAETGHRSVASTYYDWWERIKDHRKGNVLPPISEADAQDQLCAQLPPEWCEGSDPNRPFVNPRFSLGDVGDVMRVIASWIGSGFQFVSQAEADRRARICVGCYNNINVAGCGACHQLGKFITGALAQRKTPYDESLKVCGVCRCVNRAQVHIPLENLAAKDSPEKQALYPAFCWQKQDGENFLPAAV